MGNSETTWLHEASNIHWPRDLLTEDLQDCRILTFGYDADVVNMFSPDSNAAKSQLSNHAEKLVENLVAFRRKTKTQSRPIIFIAHSLGGLIVQHALHHSKEAIGIEDQLHLAQLERCTYGLIFLGVPNHGSDRAAWGLLGTKLAKCLLQDPNDALLEALRPQSELLWVVHSQFLRVVERRKSDRTRRIRIMCFYEELETVTFGFRGIVVAKRSATIGFQCSAIHASHSDMVKFGGKDDNGYKDVLDPLERWREELLEGTNTNPADRALAPTPAPVTAYSLTWDAFQEEEVLPSDAPFLRLNNNIAFEFRPNAQFRITHNRNVIWATRTHEQWRPGESSKLIFQADGNLVIYIEDEPVWESRTHSLNARTLWFRNEQPYLSISRHDGQRLWDSSDHGTPRLRPAMQYYLMSRRT